MLYNSKNAAADAADVTEMKEARKIHHHKKKREGEKFLAPSWHLKISVFSLQIFNSLADNSSFL
jgi:hypothetical protein